VDTLIKTKVFMYLDIREQKMRYSKNELLRLINDVEKSTENPPRNVSLLLFLLILFRLFFCFQKTFHYKINFLKDYARSQ